MISITVINPPVDLDTNTNDIVATAIRGFSSLAPWGSVIGDVIANVIPGQKAERMVEEIKIIDTRLRALETQLDHERLVSPASTFILEESLRQASRALSHDRLEQIASIAVNGLTDEDLDHSTAAIYFALLETLTDPEIMVLIEHGKHVSCRKPSGMRLRSINMSKAKKERDADAIKQFYVENLLRLNLLRDFIPVLGRPNIDPDTGMADIRETELTDLGRAFLRQIGFDFNAPVPRFDNV